MAVIAFVAFWVLVAVGLTFIAISGGPGGARERMQTQSRGGRKGAFLIFAIVLLAFGIAVPIAASIGVKDRESIPEADISHLSKQEQRGRTLFSEYCRLCHTLEAANAVASVGPNLDQLRPTKPLVLDAIHNGRARGNGAMARDLVVGQDADDVASFVCRAVGKCNPGQ
jgi:mono/diheme cytochrome c family protein